MNRNEAIQNENDLRSLFQAVIPQNGRYMPGRNLEERMERAATLKSAQLKINREMTRAGVPSTIRARAAMNGQSLHILRRGVTDAEYGAAMEKLAPILSAMGWAMIPLEIDSRSVDINVGPR